MVADTPTRGAFVVIPKVLHQLWIGGTPPEQFSEWREQWIRMHPDWTHAFWGDEIADDSRLWMYNRHLWDAADDIAPGHALQFRADLARYEILYQHGGVWIDMDCEPLRPFDPLLDAEVFLGWETDNVWANNAVMGAVPEHEWIGDLVNGLTVHVERLRGQGKRPNVLSGPQYITPRLTLDITVHPQRTFYPYLWSDVGTPRQDGPFPDSYCVHHWNNTRSGRRGRRVRQQGTSGPEVVRRKG